MEVLYNQQKITTEEFRFSINTGGELNLDFPGPKPWVSIEFIDKKLADVSLSFPKDSFVDKRSYWYLMGAISAKIKELEEKL